MGLLISGAALGQADPAKIELTHTYDRLSNGFADWRSVQLFGAKTLGPRRTLYGSVLSTHRFGLDDIQMSVGNYAPAGNRLTALVEVSVSPTHRVMPSFGGTAQLHQEVGNGWVVSGGINHTAYSTDSSTGLLLGAERYFGRYRAAYSVTAGWTRTTGTTYGNRLSLTEYVTDRSSYTVSLAFGRDVEVVRPGVIVKSDVFGIGLDGLLSVAKNQSIRLGLGHHRQGTIYTRNSFTIGYRYEF